MPRPLDVMFFLKMYSLETELSDYTYHGGKK